MPSTFESLGLLSFQHSFLLALNQFSLYFSCFLHFAQFLFTIAFNDARNSWKYNSPLCICVYIDTLVRINMYVCTLPLPLPFPLLFLNGNLVYCARCILVSDKMASFPYADNVKQTHSCELSWVNESITDSIVITLVLVSFCYHFLVAMKKHLTVCPRRAWV